MKQWTKIVMVALSLSTSAMGDEFKERAKKIGSLYKTGILAVEDGEIEAARAAFKEILTLDPNHGHARYQLGQLKQNFERVKMARRKALFKSTKLAKVDFHELTLKEALEALNYMSLEVTEKEFSPNFVVQDPKGVLKNVQINLTLNKVPLSAALKYTLEQAGAVARYDSHATIIRPVNRQAKK